MSGRQAGPKGWALRAALGPLTGRWTGQECTVSPGCTALAVVGTPDGWRCADHPPLPGPPGKAGWGSALDWTPHPRSGSRDAQVLAAVCAIRHEPVPRFSMLGCPEGPGRCGCGRCDNYSVKPIGGSAMGATDLRRQRKVYGHDAAEGRRRRDEGLARAADGKPEWSQRALEAIAFLARDRETFTADDLVERVGLPAGVSETNRNNAIGAAFSTARLRRIIERVPGAEHYSQRPESHGRRIAVWTAYVGR